MPGDGVWNVDWLAKNATRNFPIVDGVSREDTTGSFTIPNDLITDLVFPVSSAAYTDPTKFYVLSVIVFPQGVIINIGYDGTMIATASVSTTLFTTNSSYPLYGQGDFIESVGSLVIGSLDSVASLSAGTWSFVEANTRLLPSVIRPALTGVSSITTVNGVEESDKLYGDIALVAGQNTRLRVVTVGSVNTIYIDFIDGEGTIEECDCDNLPEDAIPIKTINGIPPNSAGNFSLLGSDCLLFNAITNGISISDVCSEPCCGCEELEVVTDALNKLDTSVTTQGNYIGRLDGSMAKLLETVIASRLSEIG
jgi:hypothetical protein